MKFCKDCRFYKQAKREELSSRCLHPSAEHTPERINLVSGRRIRAGYESCAYNRGNWNDDSCGKEARHFEQRHWLRDLFRRTQ